MTPPPPVPPAPLLPPPLPPPPAPVAPPLLPTSTLTHLLPHFYIRMPPPVSFAYGPFPLSSTPQEKARMRMMKHDPDETVSYWDNLWGKLNNSESTEDDAKERVRRAAAAARRWREYSRAGADRRPTFKLPEAMPNKEK